MARPVHLSDCRKGLPVPVRSARTTAFAGAFLAVMAASTAFAFQAGTAPEPASVCTPNPPASQVGLQPQLEAPAEGTVRGANRAEQPGGGSIQPGTVWPPPHSLLLELEALEQHEKLRVWARATHTIIWQFRDLESFDDPRVEPLLHQLAQQINAIPALAKTISILPVRDGEEATGPLAVRLRATEYALIQFWNIAGAVYRVACTEPAICNPRGSTPHATVIPVSAFRITLPDLGPAWNEYLELGDLRALSGQANAETERRRTAAQKFLARLTSPVLDDSQRLFLAGSFDDGTIDAIRLWAREPVDLRRSMEMLDAYQRERQGYHASQLARAIRNLGWRDEEAARLLAATMDEQLRGPNLRISISDEFLNRLLPAHQELAAPVRENVLGADVRGHSRIANRLQIRLIPDPERIQLRLESIGLVRSRTEASQRGITVGNEGDSRFQVFKRLAIGRNGIQSDQPLANVSSSSRVVSLRSEYDSLPIIGWMARKLASKQIAERAPIADRLVENRIRSEASRRMEDEIDLHLSTMRQFLTENLINPLTSLELEPTPTEMRTTEDRIIMQYRMAGRDQLAGTTARPLGLQGSLLSMQLHESLFNNLLARIELAGESFTGDELVAHLGAVFGEQVHPDERIADAEWNLEFAPHDPVALHFDDGRCVIELNLRGLRVGKGKTWKNLTVQATYTPIVEGNHLRLAQDPNGISLRNCQRFGLRDQAAIRSIFTALFRGEYRVDLLPEALVRRMGTPLQTSQFDLENGWLAFSMDAQGAPAGGLHDRPVGRQSQIPSAAGRHR